MKERKSDFASQNDKEKYLESLLTRIEEIKEKYTTEIGDGWIVRVVDIPLECKDKILPRLIVLKLIDDPETKKQMKLFTEEELGGKTEQKKREWTIVIEPDFKKKKLFIKQIDFYIEGNHMVTVAYTLAGLKDSHFNPKITSNKREEIKKNLVIPQSKFNEVQRIGYKFFNEFGGNFPSPSHPDQFDLFEDKYNL